MVTLQSWSLLVSSRIRNRIWPKFGELFLLGAPKAATPVHAGREVVGDGTMQRRLVSWVALLEGLIHVGVGQY